METFEYRDVVVLQEDRRCSIIFDEAGPFRIMEILPGGLAHSHHQLVKIARFDGIPVGTEFSGWWFRKATAGEIAAACVR